MTELETRLTNYINTLWEKAYKDVQGAVMPEPYRSKARRRFFLLSQGVEMVVRRAWARGDRYIYLCMYGDDAELISRQPRRKTTTLISIDLVPLMRDKK